MVILCNVDQAAAIRRGVNASSTVKLEVDVATLNEDQRNVLARRFKDGAYTGGSINTPDMAGLVESLDAGIADEREHEEKKRQEFADLVKLVANDPSMVVSDNGSLRSVIYTPVYAEVPMILKELPESTMAEVREAQAKAKAAYEQQAAERKEKEAKRLEAEAKRIAEQNAARENCERIIREFGSDMQKERLKRGLMGDVKAEATKLVRDITFADVKLSRVYVGRDNLEWPEDMDPSDYADEAFVKSFDDPGSLTDDQMRKSLAAENKIKEVVPDATVRPVYLRISLRHREVPWTHVGLVVAATATREGIEVEQAFCLE